MARSNDLFAAGYAVRVYGISRDLSYWRYGDETITVREDDVPAGVRLPEFSEFGEVVSADQLKRIDPA